MEVGDLVRLTTNEQQGLGIVISKKNKQIPVHWIFIVFSGLMDELQLVVTIMWR